VLPAVVVVLAAERLTAEAAVHGLGVSQIASLLLIVLVLGAGTDYALFLMFRVREEMRAGLACREAIVFSVARVGETITFSAGILIAALLSLAAASFSLYSGLAAPLAIAIGLMLELTRHIGYENARLHSGAAWQTTIGVDLEGMTLGVLGLGKLGARTASIAKAFGMKVIAWSQNLTAEKCRDAGVEYAAKDDLFRQSDFITIHVVLSRRTRALLLDARSSIEAGSIM